MGKKSNAGDLPKGRRFLQTEEQLKDALLELLKTKHFDKLTVAELCRQAQVTRATFYQHYENLSAILDDVIGDAACILRDVSLDAVERCFPVGKDTAGVRVGQGGDIGKGGVPLCHLVVYENRYQPLFYDGAVADRFVEYVVELSLEGYRKDGGNTLSREQLRAVNTYRMHGCLAVARAAVKSGEKWPPVQAVVDRLSFTGLGGL